MRQQEPNSRAGKLKALVSKSFKNDISFEKARSEALKIFLQSPVKQSGKTRAANSKKRRKKN